MNKLEDTTEKLDQKHSLSAQRAVVLFVIFLVLQFLIGFLLSIPLGIYVIAAVELGHMESSAQPEFIALFDLPIGMLSLLLSALIIFQMTRRTLPGSLDRGAFESLGWRATSSFSVLLACCIGAVIAVGYLFILVPAVPPAAEGQHWGPLAIAANSGGWQRFYWAVLALLFAPLIEEYVFRGILFTGFYNAFGTYLSATVVTFLFVITHMPEALHYWPAWIGIVSLGVVTIMLRIKTRSLLPAIAAHFSYNFVLVTTVYVSGA